MAGRGQVCDSRPDCALCDARIMDNLIKEINADGFNGDHAPTILL